jgi:hypothetical protein
MSLTQNRWFRRFGLGAVAALSLFAATMTTTSPVQAHEFRGAAVAHHIAYFPRAFFG